MQFLVQIESTKNLYNTTIIVIKLLYIRHDDVVMLNPPTLVEHNNDYVVNGIILRCSPPKSSNRHFDKKIIVHFPKEDLDITLLVKWLVEIMSFMQLIYMLPHMVRLVYYDQRLVLKLF